MLQLRRHRSRRGQALVEFALIIPIFVLLMMGILDLSRAVYYSSTLSNSAREAARLGIVDQTCSHITGRARDVAVGVTPSLITVTWNDGAGNTTRACQPSVSGTANYGDRVVVTVQYVYTAATPIIGNLVGTIHLGGTSTFPVEATCVEGPPPTCPAGS